MPSGLMLSLSDGTVTFDQTMPLVKFLGTITIGADYTGAAYQGSIYDPRITQYALHRPDWCRIDGGFNSEAIDARWQFDGNSLIWTYPIQQPQYVTVNGSSFLINRPKQTISYFLV